MQLRSNQKEAVDEVWKALEQYSNTLMVAATGYGKTITMAGICEEGFKNRKIKKALVIQHRDVLSTQNKSKFSKVTCDKYPSTLFNTDNKSFKGRCVFGMIQTLAKNLDLVKKVDLILIDEAHRAPSKSYMDVINHFKSLNPDVKIVGVTATPVRGDSKTLRSLFNNVAYVCDIPELIANGYLVPPKTFKPEVHNIRSNANSVDRGAHEFDMKQASKVVNVDVVNDEVVRHWEEKAISRKTIVFCTDVQHAMDVREAFAKKGHSTGIIHSKMPKGSEQNPKDGTVRKTLQDFENNKFQILINVMILTEGFDDQLISCVVILRPAVHKLTFVQIVGRGLRKVDLNLHPGWIKLDCILMDFCTNHDDLEVDVDQAIAEKKIGKRLFKDKVCPSCLSDMPPRSRECYLCGHEFPYIPSEPKETVDNVNLTEIDLLRSSKFIWIDLFDNGRTMMACSMKSWAVSVQIYKDRDVWAALGSKKDEDDIYIRPVILDVGHRAQCTASCVDWMSQNGKGGGSNKSKSWISNPPTSSQVKILEKFGRWDNIEGMTRYSASARIQYMFNEPQIRSCVEQYKSGVM